MPAPVRIKPNSALAALMREDAAVPPSEDRLERVREALREARDLQEALDEAELDVVKKKKDLTALRQRTLPDLFTQAGVDNLGLPAEGNHAAYDCKLRPYYMASMPKDEDVARQGYDWLERDGSGDIIRRTITADLDKDSAEEQKKIEEFLDALDVDFSTRRAIPWATLTSWLKERHLRHREQQQADDPDAIPADERVAMPPLDLLGATIGQQVDIKERREKKK